MGLYGDTKVWKRPDKFEPREENIAYKFLHLVFGDSTVGYI